MRRWGETAPFPIQPEELEVLSPDGRQSLLDWMETEYYLSPKVHGLSHRWSREYAPFWVPIIECLSDTETREIIVSAAAQSGKSTVMTGWVGYTVDRDPTPMAVVMPRAEDASERMETNIRPMFEENTRLLRHAGGNARNINIGKLTMFDNMVFYLLFAGVAAELANKAVCRIGADEAGKYEQRIANEADPISLMRDRARTFKSRSKLFIVSTPVLKDDLFDSNFGLGDECEWWVPCPHCGRWQFPHWSGFIIDRREDGEFFDPEVYRRGRHARYVCTLCGVLWTEADRWSAVREGQYVPDGWGINESGLLVTPGGKTVTVLPKRTVRSFRVPATILHPAIQTVSDLAADFVRAYRSIKTGDSGPMQNFVNSQLARVWQPKQKTPDEAALLRHVGAYERGTVPDGVQVLTAAVDVQIDHCWIAVVGWGYQFEGWLIYASRIETGDTLRTDNFDLVREYLNATWPLVRDPKLKMRLKKAGIDCGYRTDTVLDVCRQWVEVPVDPIMGWWGQKLSGRLYRRVRLTETMNRYDINVDPIKDTLFRQMQATDVPGPGYFHFYRDFPHEYVKHFLSEHQVPDSHGSKKESLTWRLINRHYPNHLWDCAVYNRFLAEISGVPSLPSPDEAPQFKNPKPIGKQVRTRPIRTNY